uniref:Ig-like domain-containing protein n=1 Tax=Poecilia mexicana TaxID=48701 RepID=A0A3B3X2Y7_9TELE
MQTLNSDTANVFPLPTSPRMLCGLVNITCISSGLHLIGSSQPIVAAPGDDVILPCRVEPEWDAVGKTVEWSRPDLRPTGPQKRVEYVFVYRFRKTDRDMMMDTYIQRTSLSQDGLRRGDVSLTIRNVSLQDQGRFRCFIPRLGIEAELLLVVGEERVQTAGSDPDLLDFFSSVLLLLLFQIQTLFQRRQQRRFLTETSSL